MRILIVEDEAKIANSLSMGLKQEGFAVDTANDGEIGYDLASSEHYDAIILDLMLPKINGMEVCRRLRDDENETPILMLTARGETTDKVAGLNMGADDYLSKPFAFEELLARVRSLTRRPPRALGIKLKTEKLVLETLTHEVKREEQTIDLSQREFALLEFMMRNKGKILSKEQLREGAWSFEANVLPNTIEVYIGYLRAKIDKPFETKLIETVRGFGYRVRDV